MDTFDNNLISFPAAISTSLLLLFIPISQVVDIIGGTKGEQEVQVSMNDNFYPHITWSVPLRNHRDPALTHVRRTQGFYTWLVAKNVNTSK